MGERILLDRLQFGFTIVYHYLFPQLTMGLALLIVILKTIAIRRNDPYYHDAARFWAKIFGINFIMGVVTGIPMEFQFGTNWAQFSRMTGGVIGQPLAMEGVFSFFLESAFLGMFLFGEKRLSKWAHWGAALMVFLGSWISGYFIIVANAWMQHPVAYRILPNGIYEVTSFWKLLLNPWALRQFAHTMSAAVVTGSFVMAAVGAFYVFEDRFPKYGRLFLRVSIVSGLASCILMIYPTGDAQGKYMSIHQPVTTAAMEGLFDSAKGAPMVFIGQPNMQTQHIDNPIAANKVLSLLIYGNTSSEVQGLNAFSKDQWPTNVPLLFFVYHIMVGLGTYFVALMVLATFYLWRGKLFTSRWLLWPLMLSFPLPYIANIAGWMSAEIGRQPWIVYGLVRTAEGYSKHVSSGNVIFTLLGFMGMYAVLSILFLLLVYRIIDSGPETPPANEGGTAHPVTALQAP